MTHAVVKYVPRRPFFDIFVGKGWHNRCRVFRRADGAYFHHEGVALQQDQIDSIMKDFFSK